MDDVRERMAVSLRMPLAKDDRMTEKSTPDAAAPKNGNVRTHQVRRHRGEGQWAKGHFTPLNPNEQVKKDDDGLNVRARIENVYAYGGFDSRSEERRVGKECRSRW